MTTPVAEATVAEARPERQARPVLLTVDDDPSVSRAVARDLRRRYGADYRIMRSDSGEEALQAIREVVLRGEQMAAILADYRMPRMNGVDFLEQAMDLVPQARRALAHRVRRHRCRNPGDQRRRCRSLPVEALGAAGGEVLSGRRRAAGGLAAGGQGT